MCEAGDSGADVGPEFAGDELVRVVGGGRWQRGKSLKIFVEHYETVRQYPASSGSYTPVLGGWINKNKQLEQHKQINEN